MGPSGCVAPRQPRLPRDRAAPHADRGGRRRSRCRSRAPWAPLTAHRDGSNLGRRASDPATASVAIAARVLFRGANFPSMADRDDIAALVHRYGDLLDPGDIDGVVDTVLPSDMAFRGDGRCVQHPRRDPRRLRPHHHHDGSPRTQHLMSNLTIDMDEGADEATGRVTTRSCKRSTPATRSSRGRGPLRRPRPTRSRRLAPHRPAVHRRPSR